MSGTKAGPSDRDASSSVELPEAGAPPRESIGTYLAAQRRLRGISIEELSQQTRIPLRSLERLESGSFDADVDGFVRGFVRTVAEALGLDAGETLNRTLREPGATAGRAAPRLSLPRVVASVLGLGLLVGAGFAIRLVVASLSDSSARAGARSPIVVRRDPVRALAEAQGVDALAPPAALSRARPGRRPSEARSHAASGSGPGSKPAAAPSAASAPASRSAPAPGPVSPAAAGPSAPGPPVAPPESGSGLAPGVAAEASADESAAPAAPRAEP